MAKRTLNWGLLSTARINRALIPPLRASKRNEVVAVASRSLEQAETYAREWDIPRVFGSYDALLDDPDVDVIYNSLPNHLHAEWTIKALHAGKHVLCEKPLAINLSEVDEMIATSRETGKVVAEAFMYRHHPQTLKVKEIVDSGILGILKLIRGSFTFMLTRERDVRLNKEMGGGSIWDIGCYPISYARMIAGAEPLEVFGWQVDGQDGIDESFIGQMRFKDDVFAQFDSSFRFPARTHMELVGTDGTLTIPRPFQPGRNEKIHLARGEESESIKIAGNELYIGEVEDMADAILLGREPRISLHDSRNNIAAILALLESARTHQPISL